MTLKFLLMILGQAAVISALTEAFKKWEPVRKHPKLVVAVLNLAAVLLQGYAGTLPPDIRDLALAYVTAMLAAMGTYDMAKAALTK